MDVGELVDKLRAAATTGATARLTNIYLNRRQWGELEALLRDPKPSIRRAVLEALSIRDELSLTPRAIVDAVAALLSDRASGLPAYTAFANARGDVAPLIVVLVEYLDQDNAKARARVVDLIRFYLEPKIENTAASQFVSEGERTLKFGAAVDALIAHVPLLVRHIVDPLSASLAERSRPTILAGTPKSRHTGVAAEKILEALCRENLRSKNRVREAIGATLPPQLQMLFSDH